MVALAVILNSCHKNNDAPGNSVQLAGNYQFLYISVQTQAISQDSTSLGTQKNVTYSNYETDKNSGTITFTQDSILSTGVGYSADATLHTSNYANGELIDSFPVVVGQTSSPSVPATKYSVIGKDSIVFRGGFLTAGLTGSSDMIEPTSGGRFSFKGDTLFITSIVNQQVSYQPSAGETMFQSISGLVVISMLRQ